MNTSGKVKIVVRSGLNTRWPLYEAIFGLISWLGRVYCPKASFLLSPMFQYPKISGKNWLSRRLPRIRATIQLNRGYEQISGIGICGSEVEFLCDADFSRFTCQCSVIIIDDSQVEPFVSQSAIQTGLYRLNNTKTPTFGLARLHESRQTSLNKVNLVRGERCWLPRRVASFHTNTPNI